MSFKKRITELERKIAKKEKELGKLKKLEAKSRKNWTKQYGLYRKAAKAVCKVKDPRSKKKEKLEKRIIAWDEETVALTKKRDDFRSQMHAVEGEMIALRTELSFLREQETSETRSVDEVVTQVFNLNETVVKASENREDYLKRHVFKRLIGEDGKLRSQVSFTSSDGLRRVVAMVNTMTLVQGDMAAEAKAEIGRFFERFQKAAPMDANIKALYDLTHQLLVEKTSFKVGPDLYRFLGMELDRQNLPELHRAQTLLRQSIRSEKTNSYIRIYERSSRNDRWEVVRQS